MNRDTQLWPVREGTPMEPGRRHGTRAAHDAALIGALTGLPGRSPALEGSDCWGTTGGPTRIRTRNQPVMSRTLYR